MKTAQLGELDGPVLVFGAPASNLQALIALLGEASRRGVTRLTMICTGGLAGPCGDPGAVTTMLRVLGGPVLAGETERRLAAGPRHGGALAERDWFRLADDRIPAGDRRWLAGLPDAAVFTRRGRRFAAISGGGVALPDEEAPDEAFRAALAALQASAGPCDTVLAASQAQAFRRLVGGVEWIGTGACGLPAGDGRMQTRFVMLNHGIARLHRLAYDVEGARRKMRELGLDPRWQAALSGGPSPAAELLPGPRAA
ncbi:metallophosphoesterase [Poseidonocella sp. HB161398]|uniref:metallophosphoesterase n=1 Tax=Poseidonocella sp. HB161398 TaxID=2320855 RepID=UPI00110853C7|nr:metallophosphoesterase [Poseidonocella sp. HB161398]